MWETHEGNFPRHRQDVKVRVCKEIVTSSGYSRLAPRSSRRLDFED